LNTLPGAAYPAKAARYESLDHWRGAACLGVVVFHATMQVAGPMAAPAGEGLWASLGAALLAVTSRFWIGVPAFFVISGYCIMATIDSRRRRGDGLGEYLRRRVWRIYPPYWIALSASVMIVALFESTALGDLFADGIFTVPHVASLSPWQWLGNLSLTETWRAPLAGGHGVNFLPNTWTLNYEEQFYLVAGLILLVAPRRMFLAAAVITGLVVAAKVASHLAGVSLDGTFADGRWLLIAAGILVYYKINYATARQSYLIYGLLACGLLIADKNPRALLEATPNHGIERFVACGFALFLAWAYRHDASIAAARLLAPLRSVGKISYSVYLAHPLVAKGIGLGMLRLGYRGPWETLLITAPLALVGSLAAAWVFHRLVERHFLPTDGERPQKRAPQELTEPATPVFSGLAGAV
jgi:peptidoglycan/LPS O-acetylase OafA/YrhL